MIALFFLKTNEIEVKKQIFHAELKQIGTRTILKVVLQS